MRCSDWPLLSTKSCLAGTIAHILWLVIMSKLWHGAALVCIGAAFLEWILVERVVGNGLTRAGCKGKRVLGNGLKDSVAGYSLVTAGCQEGLGKS